MLSFSKKTLFSLQENSSIFQDNKVIRIVEGYTVDVNGFPFGIIKKKNDEFKQEYWLLVNRFSGRCFYIRFKTKQEAESFFQIFSELYDYNHIDFKDPCFNFNYHEASLKVQRLYIKRSFQSKG